jgi:hypothetical protein
MSEQQGHRPTVSVGIPVYNGENYLENAMQSVLDQTMDDLELVVCDNASTDRTPIICQDLAATDPRVRYEPSETNIGASPNYNRVFRLCRGTYFKWLAHDDRILPRYLETTVAALAADPDAVLCNTMVDYIDKDGEVFATYDTVLRDGRAKSPSDRFATLILRSHSCVDCFGLVRRNAMVNSVLQPSFHGGDRVFLAQMALRGPLLRLDEHLMQMREHSARYTRAVASNRARVQWHENTNGRWSLPTLTCYRAFVSLVAQEQLSPAERRRCRRVLASWWLVNWNTARVAVDALDIVAPGMIHTAERVKTKLLGPGAGHFHDR